MAPSTLVNVLDAIVTGMATVTNLSSTAVTKFDYRVLDLPYSAAVTPELSGEQSIATADAGYLVVHRVKLQITVTQRGDVQDLMAAAAAMIPLVLTWFRANDRLGLTDCLSAHWEPLTWRATDTIEEAGGVLRKSIVFTATIALSV
jgi:hypothetical protein